MSTLTPLPYQVRRKSSKKPLGTTGKDGSTQAISVAMAQGPVVSGSGNGSHMKDSTISAIASLTSSTSGTGHDPNTNHNGTRDTNRMSGDENDQPQSSGSRASESSEEDSSDDSGSESSSEPSAKEEDTPVTGFAVAGNKRNVEFHGLFPTVPEGDYLIEDYGCALQKEILLQGRIYISENHICFHANIFGWITDLSIPIYEILSLEKKMTAFVIPNAIQITTQQAKYTFASFLSRDATFDVIYNVWRLARPEEDRSSFLSSGKGSLERVVLTPGAGTLDAGTSGPEDAASLPEPTMDGSTIAPRKATQCTCGKEGKHYSETAMEAIVPGTPEQIHNLMFASGFVKDFMVENQKLLDIQTSDWEPIKPGSNLLKGKMTFIKPLNNSFGPKQTKCELTGETVHCDFNQHISTLTTTRTPEVPSGGVFSVKTRTCIMWAGPFSSKVLVTTQVEWTGGSFVKRIIERSAIEGQKLYHSELEKSMRAYIKGHKLEFLPNGALEPAPGADELDAAMENNPAQEELGRRNDCRLQLVPNTFDDARQVGVELVRSVWDLKTSTGVLWFFIVILAFSNLWTLMRLRTDCPGR